MIKAEEIINEKKSKNLTDLEIEYFKANKNPEFKKFTAGGDIFRAGII